MGAEAKPGLAKLAAKAGYDLGDMCEVDNMDCTASDPRPDWPDATPTARLTAVSAAPATPCPDVQPASVVAQYNLTKHTGRFYELYYKDPLERPCTCFGRTVRSSWSEVASSRSAMPIACG